MHIHHDGGTIHIHGQGPIDLHVHSEIAPGADAKLDSILAQLSALAAQEKKLMADVTSIKKLVTDLNDETNSVAAKIDAQLAAIQALKDQIAAGTAVSQADLDEIGAGLQATSDRLKVLGSDPADPIPVE
jgi:enamine deaminase RidA (YjgF/YER057c/UK114 family)